MSGSHTGRVRTTALRSVVCVHYCRTYYKAVRVGGWGEWGTCAMRDDESRPVFISSASMHQANKATVSASAHTGPIWRMVGC